MNVGKTSLSPYEEGTDSHVDKKEKKGFIDTRAVAYFHSHLKSAQEIKLITFGERTGLMNDAT